MAKKVLKKGAWCWQKLSEIADQALRRASGQGVPTPPFTEAYRGNWLAQEHTSGEKNWAWDPGIWPPAQGSFYNPTICFSDLQGWETNDKFSSIHGSWVWNGRIPPMVDSLGHSGYGRGRPKKILRWGRLRDTGWPFSKFGHSLKGFTEGGVCNPDTWPFSQSSPSLTVFSFFAHTLDSDSWPVPLTCFKECQMPWVSCIMSLSLDLPICKMGMIMLHLPELLLDLNGIIHVLRSAKGRQHSEPSVKASSYFY